MHNKEDESHNGQPCPKLVESDACNGATPDEECRKATHKCKPVPTTKDIQFSYPEAKHVHMSRLASKHVNLFIPNKLLVDKKLHPLIVVLLFLE